MMNIKRKAKRIVATPAKPDAPNYHNYFVTDYGLVYSFERKRWLKPAYSMNSKGIKTGYVCQTLNINAESKRLYMHRLVAAVYISNPDNKTDVNHKDGNKSNNRTENLEWCSKSENTQHSIHILKNPCFGRAV